MEIREGEHGSLELSGQLRRIEIGKNHEIFRFELPTCLLQLPLEASDQAAIVDFVSDSILVVASFIYDTLS